MYNRYKTVYSIEEYFEILEKISKLCIISQEDINNSIENYDLTYNHDEKRNDFGCFHDEIITCEAEERKSMLYNAL